jgi:hypothetical protein
MQTLRRRIQKRRTPDYAGIIVIIAISTIIQYVLYQWPTRTTIEQVATAVDFIAINITLVLFARNITKPYPG